MFRYEVTRLAVSYNAAHYKTAVTYARKVSGISKIKIISCYMFRKSRSRRNVQTMLLRY